jgi:hypothetical protein
MNKNDIDRTTVVTCAAAAHEAIRIFSLRCGAVNVPHWEDSGSAHQLAIRTTAQNVLVDDHNAEQVHETWRNQMSNQGWTYGSAKDEASKTHPAMKPYAELDLEQLVKNEMFVDVVRSVCRALRAVPQ